MEGFDPHDANYLGNPLSLPPGVTTDEYGNIIPAMGMPEQMTTYGPTAFGRQATLEWSQYNHAC